MKRDCGEKKTFVDHSKQHPYVCPANDIFMSTYSGIISIKEDKKALLR